MSHAYSGRSIRTRALRRDGALSLSLTVRLPVWELSPSDCYLILRHAYLVAATRKDRRQWSKLWLNSDDLPVGHPGPLGFFNERRRQLVLEALRGRVGMPVHMYASW